MKFTIAVPSYNSEKYIGELLESLVKQTYNHKDFEVILVDDCSTDNTLKIARTYKSKLNMNIQKLDENSGGPGKPRNEAIKLATGEYIFFLDSDDYISPNTLENVEAFINEYPADTILVKMKGVNGRGVPQSMFKETSGKQDLVGTRIIYTLSPTKFFKTEMLKNNDIYFPENIKSAEDQLFTMKAYLKSENISVLADQPYYYATKREGEHMSSAYVHPEDFYYVMSMIVKEILDSNREDKLDILTIFIERHFEFSRTKNFSLKINDDQVNDWMNAFGKFADLIPEEIYSKVAPSLVPLITYAKKRDFKVYKTIEKSYVDCKFKDLKIEEGKIFVQFINDGEYYEVTDLHKPIIKMIGFVIEKNRAIIDIDLEKVLFNPNNAVSKVCLKLVSRNKKGLMYFPAKLNNGKVFRFEINIDDFVFFGKKEKIWDFFFEISSQGFSIEKRIGNKRNKYIYEKETSTIGLCSNKYYRVTPYFTKDFDNLSFYITELDMKKEFNMKYKNSKKIEISSNNFNYILDEGPVVLSVKDEKVCGILQANYEGSTPKSYDLLLLGKIKRRWLRQGINLKGSYKNLIM